jgi:hypothetical protein
MASLSEVAKLRQSIQAEIEASRRGLSGLATVASHESINARMGRLDELHSELTAYIGKDEATKFLLEAEARVLDRIERTRTADQSNSLRAIRQNNGLQTSDVARVAGLPLRIVYQAEIGALVGIDEAERILHALSYLTGEIYTLDNVMIQVKGEAQP